VKIYAIMMTYEQMDWLPWSIDQFDRALKFGAVDKVLIAEGAHSKAMPERSNDGSWEYLNGRIGNNKRYELFDIAPFRNNCNRYDKAQAATLNHMCSNFPMDDETWLFYIHDDEFFFDSFLKNIKNICEKASSENIDMVITKQLAFSFNMKLYWQNRTCYMLCRWYEGNYWAPATTLCYQNGVPYLKKKNKIKFDSSFENTTFHFNCVKRIAREKIRYQLSAEKGTPNALKWFNDVWLKADLNNLEEAYKANKKIYGFYGFRSDWPDMSSAKRQVLSVYEGKYPEILEAHPYNNVEDIRWI